MARGGWRRFGRKRFRYVNARGVAIADEEQLERIAALAIPPAWTDVWISPSPRARLQATGIDSAGRKQYRYHDSFRAAQERAKYERLLDFGRALPRLRRRARGHLRLGPYERDWACALAVGVVNKAWFRVGSERHARSARDVRRDDAPQAARLGVRRRDDVLLPGEEPQAGAAKRLRRRARRRDLCASRPSRRARACFDSSATTTSWRSPRRR